MPILATFILLVELIAAYCPRSRNDYTASLLNAILDNETIIGRSGLKNVLDDIHENHSDLATLAVHYAFTIHVFPPSSHY